MSESGSVLPKYSETIGAYTILDWYDGPLLEIAPVDISDGTRLVQVKTLCTVHEVETPPSPKLRGTVIGDEPWAFAVVRFTRGDLVKMLDLLDGQIVEDSNEGP